MNIPLVIAGAFLLILGTYIFLSPSVTDTPVVSEAFSGPTSLVTWILGLGAIFISRFNHIKTPVVSADATTEKDGQDPAPAPQSQPDTTQAIRDPAVPSDPAKIQPVVSAPPIPPEVKP